MSQRELPKMKQSLMKYVQALTVQNLYLPLISAALSAENDTVEIVKVVRV